MKKLALLALGIVGLASMAATCRVVNVSLTEINGDATFAGELTNETSANFLGHKFVVAFLDGNGNVLQTRTVDGCLRSLQANTSDFFSAASSEDPDDVEVGLARLALDSTLKTGTVVNGNLTFTNVTAFRDDENIVVSGTITNDDSDDLEDVRVCAVVKDEDDKIVVVARDNDTYDLDSDEAASFSISFHTADDNDLSKHVDVWADATNKDEDDQPTKPESKLDVNIQTGGTPTPTNTATSTSTPTATPTP